MTPDEAFERYKWESFESDEQASLGRMFFEEVVRELNRCRAASDVICANENVVLSRYGGIVKENDRLRDENDRLRELVRDLWRDVLAFDDTPYYTVEPSANPAAMHIDEDWSWKYERLARIHELGIEATDWNVVDDDGR